jgi:hypothetical protein
VRSVTRRSRSALEIGVREPQLLVHGKDTSSHPQARHELFFLERFRDEVIRACLHSFEVIGSAGPGCEQDDIGETLACVRTNSTAELQTIELRHHPIANDDVLQVSLPYVPGIAAAFRFVHGVAETGQSRTQEPTRDRVVISDQNFHVGRR